MFLTPCIIFILLSEYSAMNSKESIVHTLVLAGVSKAWQPPAYHGAGTEGEGALCLQKVTVGTENKLYDFT